LSSDESLQAADDLALAEALCGASFDVGAGGFVSSHADDCDDVERAVRGAVTAPAESVASRRSPARGGLWCDAAELGESGFAVYPGGVVADRYQELAGQLGADAMQFHQVGCGLGDEGRDLDAELLDLFVQRLPSTSEITKRQFRRG